MSLPPLTLQMTLDQALRRVTESRPAQEAVICGRLRLTYAQLQERIDRTADFLAYGGVGKGDRVALMLPPGADYIPLFFAIARQGAVVVPIDPTVRPQRLLQIAEQIAPARMVVAEPLSEAISSGLPEGIDVHLVDEFLPERMPDLPPSPPPAVAPGDLLAILYTSGTTGVPKGAMHTHRSLIAPVVASIKLRELWIHRPSLAQLPKMGRALARYRRRLLERPVVPKFSSPPPATTTPPALRSSCRLC